MLADLTEKIIIKVSDAVILILIYCGNADVAQCSSFLNV